MGVVAQYVRALSHHDRGRRLESCQLPTFILIPIAIGMFQDLFPDTFVQEYNANN